MSVLCLQTNIGGQLTRYYDDAYSKPDAAEITQIHLLFASVFYQFSIRNQNMTEGAAMGARAEQHYHYALGFYVQLVERSKIRDLQALALLCLYVRNWGKPTFCWLLFHNILDLAIENGLHRSARPSKTPNYLEMELRKRLFWCIFGCLITVSARLGRPMPIRTEDFDIEIPEAVPDEGLSETSIDKSQPEKCPFLVSLVSMRMGGILAEIWDTIYSIRRTPQTYVETLARMDKKLAEWDANSMPKGIDQPVHKWYVKNWLHETTLMLHHPALSYAHLTEINEKNLDLCLAAAEGYLESEQEITNHKAQDVSWYHMGFHVLSAFTALYVHTLRKDRLTPEVLQKVREDMAKWLNIINTTCTMLRKELSPTLISLTC